eukprot:CAMPEP_0203633966 /NCGR_PEP_ID=MMETSP0088-20131115/1024_1 /ASSEMBLY_ACC=CAM_ASM_001087 /TAXON_ID=426623 /ORGANISM="Chaetoceros affinis, Strain CCMP159" /LENGTH=76 /DNA_ID=CAMNT_0050487461 /DNA_START=68 /DNA_END=295 /DNA_ORIENTATION=+
MTEMIAAAAWNQFVSNIVGSSASNTAGSSYRCILGRPTADDTSTSLSRRGDLIFRLCGRSEHGGFKKRFCIGSSSI